MLTKYAEAFEKLRSDTSRARWSAGTKHRAPHKPLLLLAVLDSISQGAIKDNLIELTPDLCETFTLYWARVMPPDKRGDISTPFFHLTSESFWQLVPRPGKEVIVAAASRFRSINELNEVAFGAKFDDELFSLLRVREWRDILRSILVEKYFAPEVRAGLLEQSAINDEAFRYSLELLKQEKEKRGISIPDEIKPAARDQGFRRAIVTAYAHRCTTCGLRILTADGHTVVEAAHIIPFSVSFNDDPRNGLCLCRLCHWNFDEGMLSVSARYEVMTSPQLAAQHNLPSYVVTFAGRSIIHPIEELFLPDLAALEWHRQNVFRNR
ncbi:MAG: HNH endonuclease [Pyrinomonadaceae bacterium]